MAIINLGDGLLSGLSTDLKPKPNSGVTSSRFIEFFPDYSKFTTFLCDGIKWIPDSEFEEEIKNKTIDFNLNNIINLPAGFGGENNTANNIGTTGIGIFRQKVGVEFQFDNVDVGSTKLTLTEDPVNNVVVFDVAEANLTLGNIGGSASKSQLPAAIAYEDEANIFTLIQKFEIGLKVKPITVPTTDASYGIFYSDSADSNKPKFKKPDGTVIDMTGGTGGEVNTASNVGAGGVGVFKQKTTFNLEFKNINVGSGYVSVTNDTGNNEIDIDVVNVAKTNVANVFTTSSTNVFTSYRTTNTIGAGQSFLFDMNDSASAEKTYVRLDSNINDNTAGAENAEFIIRLMAAGSLGQALTIDETGLVSLGVPGVQRLRLDGATGLTGIRTFTFPNASTQLAGLAANTFTADQKISSGSSPLTLYRANNTVSNGVDLLFDLNDSASAEKTYARIDTIINTNTAGAEDAEFSVRVMAAGTLGKALTVDQTGLVKLGVPNVQRLRLDGATGLTAQRTFTFPDATALLTGANFANNFTSQQKFSSGATPILLYRAVNTVANGTTLSFDLNDSASNETTYMRIDGNIIDNTDGSEDGELSIALMFAGTLSTAFKTNDTGILEMGVPGTRHLRLDGATGLTGNRTFTFPDATALLAGQNFANAFSATQTFSALVDVAANMRWSGDISPTQITGDQNDYNPAGLATASTLRLNTDASHNITGLAGGADGRIIVIHNIGSFDIVLTNQDTGSTTAGDRFLFGVDFTIAANKSVTLMYDSTTARWRMLASPGSGGGGSGEVNTASNVGAGGVGVFKQKTTFDLEFKNINAASAYITIADDTGNNEVDIDVGTNVAKLDATQTFTSAHTFNSSILKVRNPADTFSYIIVGGAIAADRNITLPLLAGNDVMVTEAFAQTLTNKTIVAGSNTITGIVDANISAHTSTKITITDKTHLNSAIVYTDQTNTFGAFDQIFPDSRLLIQNPAATFSYTIVPAAIAADRTITLPLLAGNDTLVTAAFAQALTNKTIVAGSNTITGIVDANITAHTSTKITITDKTHLNSAIVYTDQTNTFGAFDQIFPDSRLLIQNPAATFSYTIVPAAIAADRTITLPLLAGNDTLVTAAFAQALTNKTIVAGSNTITGIVDANITAHTSTKITITDKTHLNTAIVYTDQANTFGAFAQLFPSSQLKIRNPADTFSYTIVAAAIAADRSLTLPLITGTDTLAVLGLAQTFTAAQTFNTSLLKLRNPADTFSYTIVPAAIAADRSLTLPLITGTDTLATLGLAQTFTAAQTFNDSLLKLRNPADTFSYTIVPAAIAANRNLNLPLITGTDTIAVLGLAQTFTVAKTFNSSILKLRNPADTFSYTVVPSAIVADRNLTVPLLTADDTIAVLGLINVFSAGQQFDNFTDYKQISAPANPSANYGRLYLKSIDANNDGLFLLVKKASGFVEVQIA